MVSLIFYRLRHIIIIIAFIGFIAMGSIFTCLFDIAFPNGRYFGPIELFIIIIRIIIMGIGLYLIENWYNKKWWGVAAKHFNRGINLMNQGQVESDEVLSEFENAIKNNPFLWEAYFNASNIYYLRKDYIKALEYIRAVIKLKPKFAVAYLYLGKFLHVKEIEEVEEGINTHKLDLYKEAIEAYKKALKLGLSKENRLQSHALLSEIYFQLGLIDDGEKELREVLKIEPNNKIAHDYLHELVKKGIIEKRGRFSFFS